MPFVEAMESRPVEYVINYDGTHKTSNNSRIFVV